MGNKNRNSIFQKKEFFKNRQPIKTGDGFTLIELLVVIAIIALLASIALIAYMSAQQKGRDARRLADMAQMNTGLSLFFSTYQGYPSSPGGLPAALVPNIASSLPVAPQPPDGACVSTFYPPPVPGGVSGGSYYYVASGTPFLAPDGITTVYPDYGYYFCLGNQAGNFGPGVHVLTSVGIR